MVPIRQPFERDPSVRGGGRGAGWAPAARPGTGPPRAGVRRRPGDREAQRLLADRLGVERWHAVI
ncbi:MAG: hypothetical protein ACTIAJ_06890, partial [Cellulosimicrobium funkei]|uniref:hypothetical protein n=1 Tax=Cellulosimicrobium funkei TaxID=264251 RepID=UPI003F92280B